MSCMMTGCRERATDVIRGVAVRLPGHPANVNVGDINVCPKHKTRFRVGARASIQDDVITAALSKRL